MENILFWMIVGIVAGWLAKMAVPSNAPGGLVGDFIVGILGSIAGVYMFNNIFGYSYGGLIGGIGVAFVGAVVLLTVLRLVSCKCTPIKIS